MKQYNPVDGFVTTCEKNEDLVKIVTSVIQCHKILEGKDFRPIRIVAVLNKPEISHDLFEKLAFITSETDTEKLVSISIVDPTVSTVNLLDLAVRGGDMSTWLDASAHLKRRNLNFKY